MTIPDSSAPPPGPRRRLVRGAEHGRAVDLTPTEPDETTEGAPAAYDPLRLCVFATVSLLSWLAGPWALGVFAALGFAGYWRARRGGLLRSRCLLGDTRIVLVYLFVLLAVAAAAIWHQLSPPGGAL